MPEKLTSIMDLGEGIKVIVITGGPCSGKTTGMAQLFSTLSDRGYKVLIVPEAATKLISAGMTPGELSWDFFQKQILLDVLMQEERIFSIAKEYRDIGKRVVVLCDRGAMDGEAYVGIDAYLSIVSNIGLDYGAICNRRYHAVMHLRTTALGAETYYTCANNSARSESPEQARRIDQKTLEAWQRHFHPRVIDNSTNFEDKIRRLFKEICGVLGDPVPLEQEEKFLIEMPNLDNIPVAYYISGIIQDYLISPGDGRESRVRARIDAGGVCYYHTIKKRFGPGVRLEEERMIDEREYKALLALRNPRSRTIKKKRICFFYAEQFFELDIFDEPVENLAFLEIELTNTAEKIIIPPFIKVIKNVTNEKGFSNRKIALNGNIPD